MAQDTVDNSGWQNHLRYISVWGPLAAIQLSTIGGLGYFYGRLTSIDQNSAIQPVITTTLKVEPAPVAANSYPMFEQPPKITRAALHIPATLIEDPNPLTMQVGENFAPNMTKANPPSETATPHADIAKEMPKPSPATLPNTVQDKPISSKPIPLTKQLSADETHHKPKTAKLDTNKPAKKDQTTTHAKVETKEKHALKTVTKSEKVTKVIEKPLEPKKTEKTATSTSTTPAKISKLTKTKHEKLVVTAIEKPIKKSVKIPQLSPKPLEDHGRWVYLGELRDYGWYGQKLHVAPDSGLPNIGQTYRTQLIHGTYDQPHGNRSMGGFQQGDVVQVENVQRETDGKVWAKLSKVHDVGRFDE